MAKPMKYASASFTISFHDEDLICKASFQKFLDEWSPTNDDLCNQGGTFVQWLGGNMVFVVDGHIPVTPRGSKWCEQWLEGNAPATMVGHTPTNHRGSKWYKIAEGVHSWRGKSSSAGSFWILIDHKKRWPNEKPSFFIK